MYGSMYMKCSGEVNPKREKVVGIRGRGEGEAKYEEWLLYGDTVSFWGDEKVLDLDHIA